MSDDPIRDLLAGALALPAVLVAHDLGLFAALDGGPLPAPVLAERLGVPARPVEVVLDVCAAAGLVEPTPAGHRLTAAGRDGFLDSSPVGYGAYLDLLRRADALSSLDAVADAVRTGRHQTHRLAGGPDAALFTAAMHDRDRRAAARWPDLVDLGAGTTLLDLGGGSGVHAHAALRRWPGLRAVVLERPEVVPLAEAAARDAGLADRVAVVAGDYEAPAPYPDADVHLWSEVLHNRDEPGCRALLGRSFDALPAGGVVLVHEQLLDDDGSPLAVAAASVNMLLWTRAGRQHRRSDVLAWLADAGFVDPAVAPVAGYFELVSARKPPP